MQVRQYVVFPAPNWVFLDVPGVVASARTTAAVTSRLAPTRAARQARSVAPVVTTSSMMITAACAGGNSRASTRSRPDRFATRAAASSPTESRARRPSRSAGDTRSPPSARARCRHSRSTWSPPRARAAAGRDGAGTSHRLRRTRGLGERGRRAARPADRRGPAAALLRETAVRSGPRYRPAATTGGPPGSIGHLSGAEPGGAAGTPPRPGGGAAHPQEPGRSRSGQGGEQNAGRQRQRCV